MSSDLWKASSTEDDEDDGEGADENGNWPLDKIVGEEVDYSGNIIYEVRWIDWKRKDGTDTSWDRGGLSQQQTLSWRERRKQHRDKLARESIDINIWGTLDIHNTNTILRSQAYAEKWQKSEDEPQDLMKEMERLLADKLVPTMSRNVVPLPLRARSTSSLKSKSPMQKRYPVREALQNKWNQAARATGAASLAFVNDIDDDEVPTLAKHFKYLENRYIYHKDVHRIEDQDLFVNCECDSCVSADSCGCQDPSYLVDSTDRKTFAYTPEGLYDLDADLPQGVEVIECNRFCSCGIDCQNRVSQRPRQAPIEIFKTAKCGWGARATVAIERGRVLGIYTGHLITRAIAESYVTGRKDYCFDLDGNEDAANQPDDFSTYTVDSYSCGNWTRFLNHSCSPCLRVYQVVYDSIPEAYMPYIAFVAIKDIPARTELTFDYDPAATREAAKGKGKGKAKIPEGAKPCECDAEPSNCRGWVRV